jgi:uncharacterized protein DUF3810
MRAGRLIRAVILAVFAAAAALAPLPPPLVERGYSNGAYAWIQPLLTSLSNLAPFALFDALLAAILLSWMALAAIDARRQGWRRASARAAIRTVEWSAMAYLLFLALWGLNYRRERLAVKLQFDRAAVSADAARRLADQTVQRLNALASPAHAAGWRAIGDLDPALADSVSRTARDLAAHPAIAGRPKRTLLDPFFRGAGVEGMTDPFLLETLVVSDLLPFERPLVIAHEWSHLAGIADEGEANFAAWLACVRGTPAHQYSGWLFLYGELIPVLDREVRPALVARLGATPRADLEAARARVTRNIRPRVSLVAWRAYDSYLKSNRVAAGTASYGQVVQLVLGTQFTDDWTPRLRP